MVLVLALSSCKNTVEPPKTKALGNWPPKVGLYYQDLTLLDHEGRQVQLSSFKGKVILLEPIGMNCAACNAFAGGNRPGMKGFQGTGVQAGVKSAEEFMSRWSDVDFSDPRLVHVQLLLYNMQMQGPTPEDARLWREHFKLDRHSNMVVLAGGPGMINQASYDMIPGFQLIDRNFVLRYDGAGHNPKHGYDELFGNIKSFLDQ